MQGTIDAILMASGFSKRFGAQNKLLTPFLGKPLICHTLAAVQKAGVFQNVFLVAASDEVAVLGEEYGFIVLRNQNPGRGMCESVRLGVASSSAHYYMFFPCDQPLLDAASIRLLAEQRRNGCILYPTQGGAPASPTLFAAGYRAELLALADHQSPRTIRDAHPANHITIAMDTALLADADTPEQLAALEREAVR